MNTTKSIHYNKISYCLQYTHESSYIQQKNTRKRGGTLYDDVAVAYQTLRRVAFAHIVETDETAQQTLEDEAESLKKTISDTCSAYETLLTTDKSKNNFQNFKSDYADYLVIYDQILEYSRNGNDDDASQLANNDLRNAGVALTTELDSMVDANKTQMQNAVTHQETVYSSVTRSIFILVLISILVFAFVVFICWKWVCKRLVNINNQLRDVIASIDAGEGDLTKRVQCFCTDEIVTRFNDMSVHLKQLMDSITESINGINTAVNESAKGATNVATNTSDLVKDIGEIADAMDDNRQVAGNLTNEADRFINL